TELGEIPNSNKAFKRIWIYFKSMKTVRELFQNDNYDVVLVNNFDMLLLYLMSSFKFFGKRGSTIAIEISDLREFVFGKSIFAKTLRAFEKILYKSYIDKLIVTSEKYYTYHFKKFYKKD